MPQLKSNVFADAGSRHGSVVVLYTHIGEIQLDGEDIYFYEHVAGAFSNAGVLCAG